MAKNKNKKVSKSQPRVSEDALLKSLNELEEAVSKGGDELLEQDPEGGLSTEGEPLSKKAPKGKGGDVEKADADDETSDTTSDDDDVEKGDGDESDDGSDADDGSEEGDDGSDDESDDESEPPMPMKKGKKVSKSFRERAEEDETMAKAIEVSDFIESLVDQVSEAHADMTKALTDEIGDIKKSIDEGAAYQRNFNGRLAKGLIDMGKALVQVTNLVKSLSDKPNPQMRKSVLSSSEITEPERGGGGNNDDQLSKAKVSEWLFEKAMAGEVDSLLVTQYEVHGNIEALPVQVRKALVNDLRK